MCCKDRWRVDGKPLSRVRIHHRSFKNVPIFWKIESNPSQPSSRILTNDSIPNDESTRHDAKWQMVENQTIVRCRSTLALFEFGKGVQRLMCVHASSHIGVNFYRWSQRHRLSYKRRAELGKSVLRQQQYATSFSPVRTTKFEPTKPFFNAHTSLDNKFHLCFMFHRTPLVDGRNKIENAERTKNHYLLGRSQNPSQDVARIQPKIVKRLQDI